MGAKMDKTRLLASIQLKYRSLEKTLERVGVERIEEPSLDGGWSVKDLLAHITFWEQNALRNVDAVLSGEKAEHLPGTTDSINTNAYIANRERPLADVWTDFHATHALLVDRLAELPDEDLADPKRFPWTRGVPLRRMIRWDTDLHYVEHNKQISAWLEGDQVARA